MNQTQSIFNPVDLLFGGMDKLGPGGDAHTLHVLSLLPKKEFRLVVDAGCGTGRQTMALAKELHAVVHAIDSHEPFLTDVVKRARQAQLAHYVQAHCMDMKDIPQRFQNIDLLWSEGAAYNIGFPNALATWKSALAPTGIVVVSEMCWLNENPPATVREYFQSGYPDMRTVQLNAAAAEGAGYKVLATYILPREAWVEGYYDVLGPRAQALLNHQDSSVRDFAAETIKEIDIFEHSSDSYGYAFFVLQRS